VVALRHAYSGGSALAQSCQPRTRHTARGGGYSRRVSQAVNPYMLSLPAAPEITAIAKWPAPRTWKTSSDRGPAETSAAFMAEPIQGVGGFITPPKEYFKIVFKIVKKYGALFIADEVQTGWGRTGRNGSASRMGSHSGHDHQRERHGQWRADRLDRDQRRKSPAASKE